MAGIVGFSIKLAPPVEAFWSRLVERDRLLLSSSELESALLLLSLSPADSRGGIALGEVATLVLSLCEGVEENTFGARIC